MPGEASGMHVFAANPKGSASNGDTVTIADFIENEANARLITTAPDGLALARKILEYFGDVEIDPILDADRELQARARAIVLKALGEPLPVDASDPHAANPGKLSTRESKRSTGNVSATSPPVGKP